MVKSVKMNQNAIFFTLASNVCVLLTFKPRIQLEILIKESVVMENPCFMAHHKKFFS